MHDDAPVTAWDAAVDAFQDGDMLRAEEIMRGAIADIEATEGPDSAAFASACMHLASLLSGSGEYARGAELLRRAVAAEIPGEDGASDRLTYLMNLGEFLTRAGQLEEAEAALQQSVDGRAALYGEDHPGYAFGLEPLADLRLLAGDAEGALAVYERCLEIHWTQGHPRVTTALAGRAMALATMRTDALLEPVAQMPDALLDEVIDALLSRAQLAPSAAAMRVIDATLALAEARCASHVRAVRMVQTDVARVVGDVAIRVEAFGALLPLARTDAERIDVLQGLALALSEAEQHADAEQAYVKAVAAAVELDDPGYISRTQRNAGLYLADRDRADEAVRLLTEAVDAASLAGLLPEQGRALIALGIVQQHAGDLESARAALTEGTTLLPPEDRERLRGRSHLTALDTGDGCGCGNLDAAMSEALMTLVEQMVGPGLVESLTVRTTPEGPAVALELARTPEDAEHDRLNRAIQQALAQLKAASDEDA